MIQSDEKILQAHDLAQAGAEQGADAFSYLVTQEKNQSNPRANERQASLKPQQKHRKKASSSKNYHDQMAIGKLLIFMTLLTLSLPAMIYGALHFITLPYDAKIMQMPDITTLYAQNGGILLSRDVEAGQSVPRGRLLLRFLPSNNDSLSQQAAAKLAKVRLQISRLETQKDGRLTWVLPEDLRQRAYDNDDFTSFVLAQQKLFADYYDALDEYGREIYTQRQRLQDRVDDARESIDELKKEKVNINARITRVNQRDRLVLRRELNFINTDINDTLALIEGFDRELQSLQPRLQRLIKRRAASLDPEINALKAENTALLQELAVDDNVKIQRFNSRARVKIAEITPHDVGDALQAGDVLYRTVAADNSIEHVTFSVAVPAEIAPFLSKDTPMFLLMQNNRGFMQKLPLDFVRARDGEDGDDAIGIYRLSVAVIYDRLQRLPSHDERLLVQIDDIPLNVRLNGFWQRAQETRRFAFDGAIDYRLPFFNNDNALALQNELADSEGFTAWLRDVWAMVKSSFEKFV
ncbi:MAG: hypothetical protein K0U39_05675 [Alphaproteobacteria bacterium]|nr:hypothetical protein [Alphaproteobacteria bacterium]